MMGKVESGAVTKGNTLVLMPNRVRVFAYIYCVCLCVR